jgi:hypothetical protein
VVLARAPALRSGLVFDGVRAHGCIDRNAVTSTHMESLPNGSAVASAAKSTAEKPNMAAAPAHHAQKPTA